MSSTGDEIIGGLAAYGRIRSTISKVIAWIVGSLMIVGGIVVIVMATMGTLRTCTACENPKTRCNRWLHCTWDDSEKKCTHRGTGGRATPCGGAYDTGCALHSDGRWRSCVAAPKGMGVSVGIVLIVVAVLMIVISHVWAQFVHSNRAVAAVAGGTGLFSDMVGVAGAQGGMMAAAPMMAPPMMAPPMMDGAQMDFA